MGEETGNEDRENEMGRRIKYICTLYIHDQAGNKKEAVWRQHCCSFIRDFGMVRLDLLVP